MKILCQHFAVDARFDWKLQISLQWTVYKVLFVHDWRDWLNKKSKIIWSQCSLLQICAKFWQKYMPKTGPRSMKSGHQLIILCRYLMHTFDHPVVLVLILAWCHLACCSIYHLEIQMVRLQWISQQPMMIEVCIKLVKCIACSWRIYSIRIYLYLKTLFCQFCD